MKTLRDIEDRLRAQGHTRAKAKRDALQIWKEAKYGRAQQSDPYSFVGHSPFLNYKDPTGELAVRAGTH